MEIDKLIRHFQHYDSVLKKAKIEFEQKLQAELKPNAEFRDFLLIKTIGTGSFGKVVMCKHNVSNKFYAMKVMEKLNIIKTKQLIHTISEIRLLDAFNFPFIIHLQYFFKDNVYIFLVMPFVNGGEMFYHLRQLSKFEESLCKFYACQVILALEYMHYLGVVYRDLKPENILIGNDGYIKLTDLGFCKKISAQRTFTLCGTPEYLAPEIILSQGYTYSVDWWSLGVLIYEMAAGFPPFFAKDHMKLYEKIVCGKFLHPPHFSKPLKNLTSGMLQVERSKRIGVLKGGSKDVKRHEWFRSIDFEEVLQKKIKPSFAPSINEDDSTMYFETYEPINMRSSPIDEYAEEFKNLRVASV